MIDFVVHSEKVESTPQGNKINTDPRFLRSSINIIVTVVLNSNREKHTAYSRNVTRIKRPLHASSKIGFTCVSSNPSEIYRNQAIDQIS